MEFNIGRDALYTELNTLKKYLSKTIPVLSNFLFKTCFASQTVSVFASDTENHITVTLPAAVARDGEHILNSMTLLNTLKNLPAGSSIGLREDNGTGVLTCLKTKLKIAMLPPGNFTQMPVIIAEYNVQMKTEDFKGLIDSLAFARLTKGLQQSDYKYEGISMKVVNGAALFSCTDKSRIAFARHTWAHNFDVELIMSAKALQDFADGLLPNQMVDIRINGTKPGITFGSAGKLMMPGIYGDVYPDMMKIVPTPISTMGMNKQELMKKLEIAQLVGMIVDLRSDTAGLLHMENKGSGTGHFIDEIPATVSNSMNISLNIRLFLDGLKAMEGDEVEILLTAHDKPAIVRPKGKSEYSYLLLPIV